MSNQEQTMRCSDLNTRGQPLHPFNPPPCDLSTPPPTIAIITNITIVTITTIITTVSTTATNASVNTITPPNRLKNA